METPNWDLIAEIENVATFDDLQRIASKYSVKDFRETLSYLQGNPKTSYTIPNISNYKEEEIEKAKLDMDISMYLAKKGKEYKVYLLYVKTPYWFEDGCYELEWEPFVFSSIETALDFFKDNKDERRSYKAICSLKKQCKKRRLTPDVINEKWSDDYRLVEVPLF